MHEVGRRNYQSGLREPARRYVNESWRLSLSRPASAEGVRTRASRETIRTCADDGLIQADGCVDVETLRGSDHVGHQRVRQMSPNALVDLSHGLGILT